MNCFVCVTNRDWYPASPLACHGGSCPEARMLLHAHQTTHGGYRTKRTTIPPSSKSVCPPMDLASTAPGWGQLSSQAPQHLTCCAGFEWWGTGSDRASTVPCSLVPVYVSMSVRSLGTPLLGSSDSPCGICDSAQRGCHCTRRTRSSHPPAAP